jgi:hypothetical protein
LDEIRVSHSVRSANWIATEYNNQFATSTFYTIGGEENSPVSSSLIQLIKVHGKIKIRGKVIFR